MTSDHASTLHSLSNLHTILLCLVLVWLYHTFITYSRDVFAFAPVPVNTPDSNVYGANMGPIWGRQDPGGPHAGPMNFAIWDTLKDICKTDRHRTINARHKSRTICMFCAIQEFKTFHRQLWMTTWCDIPINIPYFIIMGEKLVISLSWFKKIAYGLSFF